MKISEIMTTHVRLVAPTQTIQEAAQMMAAFDGGSVPVASDGMLVGMVTDRDIVIRAVATGLPPETPVREVMSPDIRYCYQDEDIEHVAENMGELQLRRLPVMSRDKRLVGIVSLGDIARVSASAGPAFAWVTAPSGQHNQIV